MGDVNMWDHGWTGYVLTALPVVALLGQVRAENQQPLNAKQVAALIFASRERYKTFDVVMTCTGRAFTDGNEVKTDESRAVWRLAGDRSYAKTEVTIYRPHPLRPDLKEIRYTRQFATTPQRSKMMEEHPESDRVGGIVARTSMEEEGSALTDLIWGLHGQEWTIFQSSDATCRPDEKTGHYVLEARVVRPKTSTNKIVAEVDPGKAFLPVKVNMQTADGKDLLTTEGSDFQQFADGLWLPRKFVLAGSLRGSADTRSARICEIVEVRLNTEIKADKLDFTFPAGAVIHDRITGRRYIADGKG